MIDIHTHILPNIDDGSQSAECSFKMIDALKSDGVDRVVFTPHFYWERRPIEKFIQERGAAAEKLKDCGIKFYLGAEVQFGELKIDYSSLTKLCIEGTRYILLELPFSDGWSGRLFDNVNSLILNSGALPIIAHIERYPAAVKKPENIEKLLRMGCLLQINAETVINAKPRGLIDVLLKNGQIQALGTDCHNMTTRKPAYKAAVDKLANDYGKDCVDYMQGCMNKILADERVNVKYIHHVKKGLFSYR